ncbi:hypothetical protein SDC9_118686 [bioreactor metagenome]|uniref:Uncharacterized protein n=1 Tax=bioreactor metagenome TaxID=1076179 RepID=A0A645C1M9_9ZZZZ
MAAGDVFGIAPPVDEIFIVDVRCAVAGIVRNGAGPARQRRMRADVVGQHQRVAAVLMRVEVVQAFHLHDARDEVEVSLAVLHHVVPGAVVARELVFDSEAIGPEHFLDDVGHRLELEDLEVRAPRGVPQPGAQHRFVAVEIAIASDVGELGDLARQKALAAAAHLGGQVHLHAQILARQALGRDRCILADQPHPVFEQARNLLASLQRTELQLLAQRAMGNKRA